MSSNTTVVGRNSYLARNFLATVRDRCRAVTHDGIHGIASSGTDCIVNFAYDRELMRIPYDPARDTDRALVDEIRETDIHLVMFSSRKVYDRTAPSPWRETSPLSGQDVYGGNKIITEAYVREKLPEQHTILRCGNIIETEPGRHTFMGHALSSLREDGAIRLDVAPATTRDFLPVGMFAAALERIVDSRPVGTFNLGSGIATAVGDIAAMIVEGFGAGKIVYVSDRRADEFLLDVSRLEAVIGPLCNRDEIHQAFIDSGRKLRDG